MSGQRNIVTLITDRVRDTLVGAGADNDTRYCLDNRIITLVGYRGHGDVGFGGRITNGLIEFTVLCDALLFSVDRMALKEQRP